MTTYSHSALSLYRLCPLRFRYHYEHKLVPLGTANRHDLDFGSAWDAGLNALYAPNGSLSLAREAFSAAYPASVYPNPLPKRSQGKTVANGLAALGHYCKRWRDEDANWEVIEIQERHKADDHDLKLDLVVRDKRDGEVYGVDNKATNQYLSNDYWKYFQPSSQVRTYTDYLTKRFGHCGGFIINAAMFRKREKAYTIRKGQPNAGEVLPAGDWSDFARMTFNPNAEALQLERQSSLYWNARIEADKLSGNFGYNDQSCHAYGRECEYYKLCEAGYSFPQDEELVLGYYRQQCPKVLDDGRCQLTWKHDGEHDATIAPVQDFQITEEEETENAICD